MVTYGGMSRDMAKGDLSLQKDTGRLTLRPDEKTLFFVLHFDYFFFREQFKNDFDLLVCDSVLSPGRNYNAVRSSLLRLGIAANSDQKENEFLIRQEIYQLLHLLKANCLASHDDAAGDSQNDRTSEKLGKLSSWMEENYSSHISLQDAADYIGFTPQYLANFMKKQLGCTFNTRLNELRLDQANRYLRFKDYSTDRISSLCGFSSPASFRSAYRKKFLTTPEQFRENYRETEQTDWNDVFLFTDPSAIRDHLKNSIPAHDISVRNEYISPIEDMIKTSLSCNVRNNSPLAAVWREMINLGSASNCENPVFRSHIVMMQRELKFHCGRITDILSLVQIYQTEDGSDIMDLSKAFRVIDFLLSVNLKPLFDLDDKDPTIYLPGENALQSLPEDFDHRFRKILRPFLTGCINRYGYEEVSAWKFELWLRHSDRSMYHTEDPKNFSRRFSYAYTTIKSLVPDAMVGGPSFNTLIPVGYLDRTLSCLRDRKLVPDFIPVLVYPYRPPAEWGNNDTIRTLLEPDPDFFGERMDAIHAVLSNNDMGDIPVYAAEFSSDLTFKNHLNDSLHQSAYIVRQILDNRTKAASFGYWLASDYSLEYPGNSKFLFGGNGLISQNGIKKPGYHAFGFLTMLGSRLIAQNDHCIITCEGSGNYQILLYNYAHFLLDFCRHPEWFGLEQNPDAALQDIPAYHLELELTGIERGLYKISRHVITAEHGCAFYEWGKLNYSSCMDAFELSHLKAVCVPDMTVNTRPVGESLHLSETLGKNEVCFITVTHIR